MALLSSPHPLPTQFSVSPASLRVRRPPITACQLCTHKQSVRQFDQSILTVAEGSSESELWAAACLRVRSFYHFKPSMFGLQDHRRYLAERELEAMKERVGGKRKGFRKVSCINATVPLSQISSPSVSDDFCSSCKGIGADFARAYLSNVCVAKELHRNGLGYALVAKSKLVAQEWGISDLYVHVAVDNEPAKKLYMKSGFVYEKDEPAWQARFLDRPRRILLWFGIPGVQL
ncbi:hypothetical protein PRUPE_1G097300 [Prunus persica]|uniref:N-acetyltransferase domain-containing protein n=1 Tax=Prunus persica TaxID=3760 RepID=A0A251QXZ1_PRUPE|nr:hypothetical protein PRUPE_1G097300 [Prunus persica]